MQPVLTEEEGAAFRSNVCRVAEMLFARHGVEGVTMQQITAEIGCSSTTASQYFEGKEEILTAVRASAFNRLCEVLEQETRPGRDARKNARNVGQAYLGFALANPDAYRVMFDVTQDAATAHLEVVEALARARRALTAYLDPLIESGSLRGRAYELGQMLWAAAHGLVMLRLSGIVRTDKELRRLHESTMSALVRGNDARALPTPLPAGL
jgi:AcrR family transcriptional regulator